MNEIYKMHLSTHLSILDDLEESYIEAKQFLTKFYSEKFSEDACKILIEGDTRTLNQRLASPNGVSRGLIASPNPIEEETILSQYHNIKQSKKPRLKSA